MIKFLLVVFISLLAPINALTAAPQNNPVPGGIVILDIGPATYPIPEVMFGQHKVSVLVENKRLIAMVGLAQSTAPGKYILKIKHAKENSKIRHFKVKPLPVLAEQNLVMLPKQLENLQFIDLDDQYYSRIIDDSFADEIENVEDVKYFDLQPLVTSGSYIPYGLIIRNSDSHDHVIKHPWITYLTAPDTVIRSPGFSIVEQILLIEDNGFSVILHHGENLRSIISNINDETLLKPGDILVAGDMIGTAGISGLSQKSRIDWRVMLNGNLIDPLQFSSAP